MLILHAGIADNQTVLWAEKSIGGSNQTRKSDYKSKVHPYAVDADVLLETLGAQIVSGNSSGAQPVSLRIWLPSTNEAPTPSSRLLYHDDYVLQQPSSISQWEVQCLLVDALEIAKLGDALSTNHVLSPGVLIGGEFAFLAKLVRFAASFVVRQKYLPSILNRGGKFVARWKPILGTEDYATIGRLCDAMPQMVRALSTDVKLRAPEAVPQDIVLGYIETFVDSVVRKKAFEVIKYIVMSKGIYLSAHDCWLHSLCSATGEMNFDLEQLNKFANQVAEWQQPLVAGEFSPFRLCFKLGAPIDADEQQDSKVNQFPSETWNIEYVLQDVKDPSLFITADDAWKNASSVKKAFALANFRPREQLLRSLGEASRLSEQVGASLQNPNPTGFELTDSGAFNFVTEIAPALQQAGFGVLLPKWWTKGPRKGIKRIGSASRSQSSMKVFNSALGLDTVIEFDWKMALGDIELTQDELKAIAALKTPLVQIRGQWMIVGQSEIQAAIEYLKGKVKSKLTLAEVIKLELAEDDASNPPGFGEAKVKLKIPDFVGEIIGQLKEPASMIELRRPQGFVGQLRPYQVRGFSWMYFLSKYGIGACLADDMGLGKTIQTLALVQQTLSERKSGPILLICPTSVVTNWLREAARFTPDLRVMVHHGAKRAKEEKFASDAAKHDLILATYGLLVRDLETLKSVNWAGVILDEAQNIKNDMTKQSKAARELRAKFKIALTGTPVENTVADLYSLMQFLNPGYLGDSYNFKENFLRPIQVDRDRDAIALLRDLTKPLVLRRLKTDKTIINDLPDKIESKEYCSLTKEQVTLYSAVLQDLAEQIVKVEPKKRATLVLSVMLRLKQICNHPAQYNSDTATLDGRSGKLNRLVEMVDEILQIGEKALIFSQFVEMSAMIKKHLQDKFGEEVLFLHGGVPRKQRDDLVERFQSASGPKLLVISLKAGGTGLNLTAANHVFHYDRWWNPAVENQASDRAFRIGQKKNVQVHKFITAGTLENAIDEVIEKKSALSETVVGSGENWLAELSNDALTKMLSLSKEAYTE
ncbi:MAG TPA: DEAD/DEAH box helicase [Drouetiella sp.]